jgi:hypothetical protein
MWMMLTLAWLAATTAGFKSNGLSILSITWISRVSSAVLWQPK